MPSDSEYMQALIELARAHKTPYAALILNQNGECIAKEPNKVGEYHDASAHAEIVAVRNAGKALGSPDLSGCRIITTCEPCPMCTAALYWSNISEITYGLSIPEIEALGQRQMPQRARTLLKQARYDIPVHGGLLKEKVARLF